MGFIKKVVDFVVRPSHSRTIVLAILLLATVSLTVYVAQQQQTLRQRASAVCEDASIQECPDAIKTNGNDCNANPTFKCKVTKGNQYEVYGCQ